MLLPTLIPTPGRAIIGVGGPEWKNHLNVLKRTIKMFLVQTITDAMTKVVDEFWWQFARGWHFCFAVSMTFVFAFLAFKACKSNTR